MDFKKLFRKNDKAVSPVIGVILMVAITVILAAAIGSSVFGMGPAKSAPQANIEIKADSISSSTHVVSLKIEHLGGSPIHFEDDSVTKVTASLNNAQSVEINAHDDPTTTAVTEGLGVLDVGSSKTLKLATDYSGTVSAFTTVIPKSGDTVNIKIIDVQTNQLICDKDIRIQT